MKKRYMQAVVHAESQDPDVIERGLLIAEQVAEVMQETIDELSLMTMGYPDNRMMPDEPDLDGEDSPLVQFTARWEDRYTPFHKEFFQAVSGRR